MTLKKALEILDLNIRQRDPSMPSDVREALKLGTSALKEINHLHEIGVLDRDDLLPGETED